MIVLYFLVHGLFHSQLCVLQFTELFWNRAFNLTLKSWLNLDDFVIHISAEFAIFDLFLSSFTDKTLDPTLMFAEMEHGLL